MIAKPHPSILGIIKMQTDAVLSFLQLHPHRNKIKPYNLHVVFSQTDHVMSDAVQGTKEKSKGILVPLYTKEVRKKKKKKRIDGFKWST